QPIAQHGFGIKDFLKEPIANV
ncbi:hypothetical protein GASC598B02_005800, partial [Gilliamella apicola SCGC AB-598-B02]